MTRISAPKQIRTGRLWFAVLFFGALMNPLMMTGPLFMLQVYDRVIPSQSGATLAALFVLAAFLYAMMALLDSARIRVLVRIAAKFRAALDRPVFEARMFALIRDPGHSATLGALQDLDMVHKAIASSAVLSVLDTLWAFAFFGILFLLHPALGLVALGGGTYPDFACLLGPMAHPQAAGRGTSGIPAGGSANHGAEPRRRGCGGDGHERCRGGQMASAAR
ncbi:hypothetical protein [Pararhodobacter sp.]|uniref:hypothetical protein n=1 Tax=Pararhodobacter sp. TaxID=2127056 RepID=UPI002AFE86B4|nr:hypothetical protein [Pararhodobacter sp.]